MPATSDWEKSLLTRFISVYDRSVWADSTFDWVDEREDGGIDLVAIRPSDDARLAIEHTVIQPAPLEKQDYARFEKAFLRDAPSPPIVAGFIVYCNVLAGTLAPRKPTKPLVDAVHAWIRTNGSSAPDEYVLRDCPIPGGSDVRLQVRSVPTDGEGRTIIRRYGDFDVDATVATALDRKLPKLARTVADKRILMLERDQFLLDPALITKAVERLRPDVPLLAKVDELWLAETHDAGSIVLFDLARPDHSYSPVYTFSADKLLNRRDQY